MDFFKKIAQTATPTTTTNTESVGGGENPQASQSELLSSAKLVADAAQAAYKHEPSKYDNAQVAGAAADLLDGAEKYGKLENTAAGGYVEQAKDYLQKYETSNSPTPVPKSSEEPEEKTNAPPPVEKPAEEAAPPKPEADKIDEEKPAPKSSKEPEEKTTVPPPTEKPAEEAAPPKPESEIIDEEKPTETETAHPPPSEEPAEEGKVEPSTTAAPTETKPPSEEPAAAGDEKAEGGVSDYAKLAEGFLEKTKITDQTKGDGGAKSEVGVGDALKNAGGFFKKN